jgi:DNA mismatch endonuclease (patch repair protein)
MSDATREKIRQSKLGKKQTRTPEHQAKLNATRKGKKRSQAYCEQTSRRIKQLWANPEFRAKMRWALAKAFESRDKPSTLHQQVKDALQMAGIETQTHVSIGYWCCDEVDRENRIVLEINGCYWHCCSVCLASPHGLYVAGKPNAAMRNNLGNDTRKRLYLAKHGWNLIELWEHEWMESPEACIHKIMEKINEYKAIADGCGSRT